MIALQGLPSATPKRSFAAFLSHRVRKTGGMDAQTLAEVTAIGSVIAAVGTVGALFAAVRTLRYESSERHRSEVRAVRTVLD